MVSALPFLNLVSTSCKLSVLQIPFPIRGQFAAPATFVGVRVCSTPELKNALELADTRLLSAVLTCVTGDVHAVPDSLDRPQIVELAMQLLPPVIDGSVLVP